MPKPPPLETAVAPPPAQATLLHAGGAPSDAPLPRLVVCAGPRAGSEHALANDLTTVGRGADNVLVLTDLSVSRRHARFEKQAERWMLVDQGSGNGTLVNGRPVDRHALRHGDHIALGDTKLRFVEPGGALLDDARSKAGPPAVPRPPPEAVRGSALRRRGLQGLAAALALGIVVAAFLWRAQRPPPDPVGASGDDEPREFAQKRMQEGVALLKAGKWVEARDKLKVAAELFPRDAQIARLLQSAQAEAPRAQQLSAGRAALDGGDLAGARAALAGIPEESALADEAQQLARLVDAALERALREAKARAESGDAAGARALLEPVLAAEPSRKDARAVLEAASRQQRAKVAPASSRRRRRAADAAPQGDGILEAYLAGDVGAAIERAQRTQAPRGEWLLSRLKAFDAAYREGLLLRKAKSDAQALRAFALAAAADGDLAPGRQGGPGREVRRALSEIHRELAASQAASEATLPQAAAHLRAALQVEPLDEAARRELARIGERCREIYLRGYAEKDADAEVARQAFRVVVETLPASDETAQKARRWLDRLDGKGVREE